MNDRDILANAPNKEAFYIDSDEDYFNEDRDIWFWGYEKYGKGVAHRGILRSLTDIHRIVEQDKRIAELEEEVNRLQVTNLEQQAIGAEKLNKMISDKYHKEYFIRNSEYDRLRVQGAQVVLGFSHNAAKQLHNQAKELKV